MPRVYLDYAATAPMPPAVVAAYTAALSLTGNAASTHADGQRASQVLEDAREVIAGALECEPVEVVLTAGGTEAINLAVKGAYWRRQRDAERPVLMISQAEHHATLDAAHWLEERQGARIEWLPVDQHGVLRPETLAGAIERIGAEQIALVSFLWANNEVGTLSPVAELCRIARAARIPSHVDAVAALGQVPISLRDSGADMLSVSAHKIGGPVGVGALALRRDVAIDALQHGGAQQRSRSGTQDVAGAVAFAEAVRLCAPIDTHAEHLARLRDELVTGVLRTVPDAVLRGADPRLPGARLPGNAHFTFPGCQGDSLLYLLDADGVSVSVGSACQAGVQEVSHVLLAMGLPEDVAIGSLRMTVGTETTREDIDEFLRALPGAVAAARRAGLS